MSTTTPASDVDLFADDSLTDPYPGYRELRDTGPAVYLEATGAWAVSRFEGVREVLRGRESFSSAAGVALNEGTNQANRGTVLSSDPPDHTKLRKVLSSQLSPGSVAELKGPIFEQADELVASLAAQGEFDAIGDLAAPFPVSVVADLIGLPTEGREKLGLWTNRIFDAFGPENARTAAAFPLVGEMFTYMATTASRDNLADGSMGMTIYEAADRGEIEAESCLPLLAAYIGAGMDTTINAIGSAICHLAANRDQWTALRDDPSLAAGAVNEVLRFDSPVQSFSRVATPGADVEGQPIPEGDRVIVLFGSANRDERKWEDPDRFRIDRNPIDHLGFGFGIHRCAGAGLARLEIEAVLTSMASRLESLQMIGESKRFLNNSVRGLSSFRVSVS
ncbi:MAG: cytochrome P450 [Solirubrobacterales bacterium]